ncbi:hypothetical protein IJI72_02320 [Candidatus Saccharibacteria bacterium]|nr:hypothetical protein [Candidatus Saccharibacteria bacterium]
MKINNLTKTNEGQKPTKMKSGVSLETLVRKAHRDARESKDVRDYFNGRGISNSSIDRFMLGLAKFDEHYRFSIPVFDRDGKVAYIKLLRTPADDRSEVGAEMLGGEPISKYMIYPIDADPLLVGEDLLIKSTSSDVLICDDELDRIIAIQEGVKMPVVTGGGAELRNEWIGSLKNMRNIYLCINDDKIMEELVQRLTKQVPMASVYKISLPCSSLTDYFAEELGTADELLSKYAEFYGGTKPFNASRFKEMTVEDIADVLDLTIKYDFVSKVVTFLVMLLAYTESDQQNVMFNASSSTGKTYICSEVSKYFPPQDVKVYGKTTPTAFYYSQSLQETDRKTGQPFINLERRILVFTEQPDTQLQENLRALLSHDNKRTPFAITNKGKNGKNTAMEGYILGFPSTFFCSANMRIDEQEQTRCLILSPESTQEKVKAGVDTSIARNSHKNAYNALIEGNEERKRLKERVLHIKGLKVDTIDIDNSDYLKRKFMDGRKALLPKTQREISHFISLVKAMALLNAPFRMIDGKIIATNKDVDEAMKLWTPLNKSMAYGVSPQVFSFYINIILAVYRANSRSGIQRKGITYSEICKEYYNQTGSYPNVENLRKQYIPALETAALVSCDKDENDKRQKLIIPLVFFDDEEDGMEETD